MRHLPLVVAGVAALAAPARADQLTPPPDIATIPTGTYPEERAPGFELHGALVPWFTPWSQDSAIAQRDAWRLRFAVLRVDVRPAPGLSVIARVGFMLPGSPLLDLAGTYYPAPWLGVTFGQFRLPLGASATTLGPQLVMLDRPTYVTAMTKLATRDVGVMLHGPLAGQAGVHYRLAFASGGGRIGSGQERAPDDHQYLVAGRVMYEHRAASWRLLVGASGAASRDPAIATGTMAADAAIAAGVLGRTLAPIALDRTTLLGGGDVTLAAGPVTLQGEVMYLHSRADDDSITKRAFGASLEAAWTLPVALGEHAVQLAVRNEWFDPDRASGSNERDLLGAGVNLTRGRLRWSVFGTVAWIEDPATSAYAASGEVTARAVLAF